MFLCRFYCLISFLQLAAFCQQFIKEMCYVMLSYDTPGLSDTEDNNTGKHAANYCRIRKLHN